MALISEELIDHSQPHLLEATREDRTFNVDNIEDVEALPLLPNRLVPSYLTAWGAVGLQHANRKKKTTPWVEAGWYRFIHGTTGKLYLLEIRPRVKGHFSSSAFMYKPIFRVKQGS